MRKSLLLLLVMLTSTLLGHAAGKNRVNRNLSGFTEIVNSTAYDIHYYESTSYTVNVVGNAQDINNINTTVSNGVLSITSRSGAVMTGTPYIEVYCPKNKLTQYTGKGKGDFIAKTAVNLLTTLFTLSGSGNITLGTVVATTLNLVTTGSGNINVKSAKVSGSHTIKQSGSGRVRFNGQTNTTQVQNSGSGNTKGHVDTNTFEGQANGTGNIKMKGKAETIKTNQQSNGGKATFKRR